MVQSTLRSVAAMLAVGAALVSPQAALAAPLPDQGQIFNTAGVLSLNTNFFSQSITAGVDGLLTGIQVQFAGGLPQNVTSTITFSIFDGANPVSGSPTHSQSLDLMPADLTAQALYTWDVSGAGLYYFANDQFTFAFQALAAGLRACPKSG